MPSAGEPRPNSSSNVEVNAYAEGFIFNVGNICDYVLCSVEAVINLTGREIAELAF